MARLVKKAESKAQVLSRWTQDNVEIFSQVCAKWENFNVLLSRHKQDINQQVSCPLLFKELWINGSILNFLTVGQSEIKQSIPDYQVYI